MNANLLDEVIDFLNASNEAALDASDRHPGTNVGVVFTSTTVFLLAQSLEQHRVHERAHLRACRRLAGLAFLVAVVALVLSLVRLQL